MSSYLLISSRDPFESIAVSQLVSLASSLARSEAQVAVFFVQNGVLAVRRGACDAWLRDLASAGIRLFADDFSLRERGIPSERVANGVQAASIDVVLDALGDGHKVVWH